MNPLLIIAMWIICWPITYGTTLAYFYGEHPSLGVRYQIPFAVFFACLGPVGLVVSAFGSNFWKHGWRVR